MSLHIFSGCMFSGKSSKCVEQYNMCSALENVLVINYILDTRYDTEMLSTHDKKKINCVRMTKLSEITPEQIKAHQIFLIDEAQFFDDLYVSVINLVENHDRTVYIYGLDGDYERKPFGQLLDLIPIATSYIKLYANCNMCDSDKACFTFKHTKKKKQIEIGSHIYSPLCRKCYIKSI